MDHINEIKTLIDTIIANLFTCNMTEYINNSQMLINRLLECVPNIIAYYFDPKMQDVAGEATYWPAQVEKIISALERGNDFETLDVLYYETYKKLEKLEKMLTARGVV